ncbi:MAG: hypothetical protein K8F62_00355 [Pseudorhodoplanes sp.]|nr:hypothetical protein [Pseudorhodoplanes sp.]
MMMAVAAAKSRILQSRHSPANSIGNKHTDYSVLIQMAFAMSIQLVWQGSAGRKSILKQTSVVTDRGNSRLNLEVIITLKLSGYGRLSKPSDGVRRMTTLAAGSKDLRSAPQLPRKCSGAAMMTF